MRYDDWIKVGYVIKSVADNDEGKALWLNGPAVSGEATEKPDRMWDAVSNVQRGRHARHPHPYGPKGPRRTDTSSVDAMVRDRAFRAVVGLMPPVQSLQMPAWMAEGRSGPVVEVLPATAPSLPTFEPLGIVDPASVERTDFLIRRLLCTWLYQPDHRAAQSRQVAPRLE